MRHRYINVPTFKSHRHFFFFYIKRKEEEKIGNFIYLIYIIKKKAVNIVMVSIIRT